jgi:hypothetical protein
MEHERHVFEEDRAAREEGPYDDRLARWTEQRDADAWTGSSELCPA